MQIECSNENVKEEDWWNEEIYFHPDNFLLHDLFVESAYLIKQSTDTF